MISLNLEKGMSLDLSKHEDALQHLNIALGWQTYYDWDSIAFLTNAAGKIVNTVCYQSLKGPGVTLDGDDTHGGGTGDNETISVDFSRVPEDITKIMICANIYNARKSEVKQRLFFGPKVIEGDTFAKVNGSFIRLYNADTKEELCRYSLKEDGSQYNAFHFADLIRQPDNTWTFEAIGVGMNGSIAELRKQLSR